MKRLILLTLLAAAGLHAQCGCGTSNAGCDNIKSGGNPDLQTFTTDVCASYAAEYAALQGKPQPPIILQCLLLPAAGAWLDTGVSTFGPAINGYMDLNQKYGCSQQFVNSLTTAWSCDASYAAFAAAQPVPNALKCDCDEAGDTLTPGASPPGGAGNHCNALHYYDLMRTHATSTSVTLVSGWFPSGDFATAFGLTPGTATPVQFTAAMVPLAQAGFTRMGSTFATRATSHEEPTQGMGPWGFSVAQTTTIIDAMSQAIKAIQPSTKISAAATVTDYNYWIPWQTDNNLDVVSLDVVGSSCNPANNQWFTYLQTMQTDFVGTAKKPIYMDQGQWPFWCPTGDTQNEANAYMGVLDIAYSGNCPQNPNACTGLANEGQDVLAKWASAAGLKSVTAPYCNLPAYFYTSDQTNDHCSTGSASGNAMALLSPTDAANNWLALSAWSFGVTLQNATIGNSTVSGK